MNQHSDLQAIADQALAHQADADASDIVITAPRKLVLQCGRSSITLHANGRIVLRGDNIVSAADGVHRIAGATIEFN